MIYDISKEPLCIAHFKGLTDALISRNAKACDYILKKTLNHVENVVWQLKLTISILHLYVPLVLVLGVFVQY